MTYKLTPKQREGLDLLDRISKEYGLPLYYDFVKASAAMAVALRDGNDVKLTRARKMLVDVLDGLRNATSERKPGEL